MKKMNYLKKTETVTAENGSRFQIPYYELLEPIYVQKKQKLYEHHILLECEEMIEGYYDIMLIDGSHYLYDDTYDTVLGRINRNMKKESLKNCPQTEQPITISSFGYFVPYQTKLFRKIEQVDDVIVKLTLLDGNRFYYNAKEKEVIGRDSEQLKNCTITYLIGSLYLLSSQDEMYLYDAKSQELVTEFSEQPVIRQIAKEKNKVILSTSKQAFLYDIKQKQILTPIFSMINDFEIYQGKMKEYSKAQFTQYLTDDQTSYLTGTIHLDGSFGEAITRVDGNDTKCLYIDEELGDPKQQYLQLFYQSQSKQKRK